MESERHAFLRKLLKLCVDANVKPNVGSYFSSEIGPVWIANVMINLEKKTATGSWDGEEHEVWL